MKINDFVFWVVPNGSKFWGILASFMEDGNPYIISDCSGSDHPPEQVKVTTLQEIIDYNEQEWGWSEQRTRNQVKVAQRTVESVFQMEG